jgi:predicted membrane channel-forming protein YqfA (hemolysin III family)
MSATYHTFGCHSHKTFELCLRFDLSGIVIAMNGGMFASIFFGYAWRSWEEES